jgi:hypothetical protein
MDSQMNSRQLAKGKMPGEPPASAVPMEMRPSPGRMPGEERSAPHMEARPSRGKMPGEGSAGVAQAYAAGRLQHVYITGRTVPQPGAPALL